MQPPDGPPVWTALILPPSGAPPPISSTIFRRLVPIGTSMRPVLVILPASANTLVPLLFSVPMPANHSAPLRKIGGTFANVSTLLINVGQPHNPLSAGNGGRGRGVPRLPSTDIINAVSSPQTNAPAPMRMSMLKLNGDSKIPLPSRPRVLACLMAVCNRLMASGYSARQ